jgi:hypothetical protein
LALAAGLPFAPLGLSIVALLWGMLEGFYGVYFSRKVNEAVQSIANSLPYESRPVCNLLSTLR